MEGVVSKAYDKEAMLVVVCGATSAGQKSFRVFGERATFSLKVSWVVKLLPTPGSRFGLMAVGEELTLKSRQWKGALT